MLNRRSLGAAVLTCLIASVAVAEPKYGPGTSATEIKVGQTIPYSGPASAYSQLAKVEAAYFKWLNAKGGINGRKINFISLDDGYSPPKAVENVRKLVESDEVAMVFNVLGTPLNMAVRPYLNQKKVPQLFIAAGATDFNNPAKFPWTMGWQPNLQAEAAFYAKDLLARKPNAKIAVLYQNDDFGKDMLNGLTIALGDKAKAMIVDAQNFQATDPTIDSQLITLKNSGADTLFLFTYAKQAAQANPKPRRPQLEAAHVPASRRGLGRRHLQAGRAGEIQGHPVGRLHEGRDRSQMGRRSRRQDVDCLDEGEHAGRRSQRQPQRGGLCTPRRSSRCCASAATT